MAWSPFMTRSFWSFPRFGSVGRQVMVKGEELLGSRLHPRLFTSPEGGWERPPITPSKDSWQLLGHRSSWLHHTRCGRHTFVFARSSLQALAPRRARLQAAASALPAPRWPENPSACVLPWASLRACPARGSLAHPWRGSAFPELRTGSLASTRTPSRQLLTWGSDFTVLRPTAWRQSLAPGEVWGAPSLVTLCLPPQLPHAGMLGLGAHPWQVLQAPEVRRPVGLTSVPGKEGGQLGCCSPPTALGGPFVDLEPSTSAQGC